MDEKPPDGSCACPDPRLCARLKFHINHRLWEVWNNLNVSRERARRIRNEWLAGRMPTEDDLRVEVDHPSPGPRIISPVSGARPLPAKRNLPERRGRCCGK